MTIADTVTRGPVKKDRPEPGDPHRHPPQHGRQGPGRRSTWSRRSSGFEPNLAVLHQVVTAQLAAIRAGTQSTKTRAQVRGGGAKPFAQKGTGRARQGSSRSPVHERRWHRPRPQAAELPPAHPEEDGPPGPPLRPERPGRQQPGRPGRRVGLGGPEDQGRRGRAAQPQDHRNRAGRAGRRRDDRPAAPSPTCPTPTPPHSGSCRPTTCCAATGSCSPTAPCPVRPWPARGRGAELPTDAVRSTA